MNVFGTLFRVSIFGESHGAVVGITVDGCPAGIPLGEDHFLEDLNRRKAGAAGTTPRKEDDVPRIMSGVFNGFTTGAPITVLFENSNTRSADYDKIRQVPRPGHADFVLDQKYKGFNDHRGGGHSSGRLTVALVAAGVIAKRVIPRIRIAAMLVEAGGSDNIEDAIARAVEEQDSIGGVVECRAAGLPPGLGEPFFDSMESIISHAVFSIPAVKGIEFGAGFAGSRMKGSEHNDAIMNETGQTVTNHAGGINGGISNGNELVFRIAVKPTSSTPKEQHTWSRETGKVESFTVKGRHDLCVALRVPVVAEAVTAMSLADLLLRYRAAQ